MSEILGVFGIDWRLLLVQGFNFGLVLLILSYVLYRPVLTLLDKRRSVIAEGVLKAEAAAQELEQITREKEVILTDATREAGTIIDRAKERALVKEADIIESAQMRGAALVKEAEEKSLEAKRKALESAREEVARMVVLGAEKILKNER